MRLVKSGGLVLNINWILYNLTRICWDLTQLNIPFLPSFTLPYVLIYPSLTLPPPPRRLPQLERMLRTSVRPSIRSFVRSFVPLSLSRARGDGDERQRPASFWASLLRVWILDKFFELKELSSLSVCWFFGYSSFFLFFFLWVEMQLQYRPGRVRRCICCCRGFTQYLAWLYGSRAEESCTLVFSCLRGNRNLRNRWACGRVDD
jgi:hypothetical protein